MCNANGGWKEFMLSITRSCAFILYRYHLSPTFDYRRESLTLRIVIIVIVLTRIDSRHFTSHLVDERSSRRIESQRSRGCSVRFLAVDGGNDDGQEWYQGQDIKDPLRSTREIK
jgi:hypothetical protein